MFDQLVRAAVGAGGVAMVGAWARVENAAGARRLSAMADAVERQLCADGSVDREQWVIDNWDAVCAEVAAAQSVSSGVASNQLVLALALRERLPAVAEVFAQGRIGLGLVKSIVARTHLAQDPRVQARIDAQIAAHVDQWAGWSVARTEHAIDYWVDRYDPGAVVRSQGKARGRYVDVHHDDGCGVSTVQASLLIHGGAALDARLAAMARSVCPRDPRTLDQRRADALSALADGVLVLACGCGRQDCTAAAATPAPPSSSVVVHVIAEQSSLTDDTPITINGNPTRHPQPNPAPAPDPAPPSPPDPEPDPAPPPASAWAPVAPPPDPTGHPQPNPEPAPALPSLPPPALPTIGPAARNPAYVVGAGMLPAPLLAATLANTAKIVAIIHPGAAPPERRYLPSAVLATFVRCRDMTCRFPGCDAPAWGCDLDHTIAYPHGPTQAANLKCLCRKHHLLKTFWGWLDEQHPDGTVVWTSPRGQKFTTHPGSRLWFPALCQPTAPVTASERATPPRDMPADHPARTLKMPRRNQTRAQNRHEYINQQRKLNDPYIAERNKPPPF